MFDASFKTPFNMLISGPSGSGKTHFIYNLLASNSDIMWPKPNRVYLFYNSMQPIYQEMINKGLVNEIFDTEPNIEDIKSLAEPHKNNGGIFIIIDDALRGNFSSTHSELSTVVGHHYVVSSAIITQNLFHQNKEFRTMSLNCHYLVLTKSPRDASQIINLAKQVSPYKTGYIVESFRAATETPYSYIIFDFHQKQGDHLRLRSHIFKHEWPIRVYLKSG